MSAVRTNTWTAGDVLRHASLSAYVTPADAAHAACRALGIDPATPLDRVVTLGEHEAVIRHRPEGGECSAHDIIKSRHKL